METGLLSVLGLIVKSMFMDVVMDNLMIKKCFQIITSVPEPIEDFITGTLHRGATQLHGEGVYSHEGKTVLSPRTHHESFHLHDRAPSAFFFLPVPGRIGCVHLVPML